ncbi:hypothetical protein B0T24DRAFT_659590 [Lasiosphaeria ovina]|uniref:Trichothecene 3-O-acetyltransferase-like N-terminal domain-containing protein n=1 Tax=Lasiosphaeria ovina TaxID=92902 RepID=A0AAE0JY49_9PEZI|nr:hypothetical protein B0T24DRAFT_659590 [Lasiosphaeria ovina]
MAPDFDPRYLSPLDQLMPRGYFGQILCFPSTDPRAFNVLRNGLRSAAVSIPYLTSFVVEDKLPSSGSGRICLSESGLDNDVDDGKNPLSYAGLRAASFPIGLLNGSIFYPQIPPHGTLPAPVLRAKATRIAGGFTLAVLVHHSVFDGASLAELLALWADSCHLDPEKHEPVALNPLRIDRKALLENSMKPIAAGSDIVTKPSDIYIETPADAAATGTESYHAMRTARYFVARVVRPCLRLLTSRRPPPGTSAVPSPPSTLATTLYRVSGASLAGLKAQISRLAPRLGLGVNFVSTNDVLSALIWSAATLATTPPPDPLSSPSRWWRRRATRGSGTEQHDNQTCTTGIAVDVRTRVSPPLRCDWLGNAFGVAWVGIPRGTLVAAAGDGGSLAPLARVAAALRRGVGSVDNARVKHTVRYLAAQDDVGALRWPDVRMFEFYVSSWVGQGILYSKDWGARSGGVAVEGMKCEAIRCLQLVIPSIAVILPPRPRYQTEEGGNGADLEFAITLEAAQMERFRASLLVAAFAEVIDACWSSQGNGDDGKE